MIATTDPNRKNVYVFADLPTGTVQRLLRTVPGLRSWGAPEQIQQTRSRDLPASPPTRRESEFERASGHTTQSVSRARDIPPSFPDRRPAAAAHTSDHSETHSTVERRTYDMADHAPAAKSGGSTAWVGPVLAIAVLLLVIWGIINLLHHGSIVGQPSTYYTDSSGTVVRVVPASPSAVTTTTGTRIGTARAGMSPEDIAARVTHKKTRVRVPCIDGYVQNEATGQCDLTTWIPGPEPE